MTKNCNILTIRLVKYTPFILLLSALAIVFFKFFLVSRNFAYISHGTDSSRVLAEIEYTAGNGHLLNYISPRLLIEYLALFEQLILGIPPKNVFLPVLIFSYAGSVLLVYQMSLLLRKNKKQAALAAVLYSLALSIIRVTYSTMFSTVTAVTLVLIFLRYLERKSNFILLLIAYFGAFFIYAPFLLITNMVFMIFALFKLSVSRSTEQLRHLAILFCLLPLVLVLAYPFDHQIVQVGYGAPIPYISRVFGLWISGDRLLYLSIYAAIGFLFLSAFFAAFLSFFPQTFLVWRDRIVSTLSVPVSRIIPPVDKFSKPISGIAKLILGLGLFIFLFDMIRYLSIFPFRFWETNTNPSRFVSYHLLPFFGAEVWRQLFLPLGILMILSLVEIVSVLREKLESVNKNVLVLLAGFALLPIVSALFRSVNFFDLLADERGLRLATPFLAVLASGHLSRRFSPSLKIIIVFLLFVLSFGVIYIPQQIAQPNIIDLTDRYNQSVASPDVLVLSPEPFPPGAITETFFALSLVPWNHLYVYQNGINNQLRLSCVNYQPFLASLRRNRYTYLLVEPGYPEKILLPIIKNGNMEVIYPKNSGDIFSKGAIIRL